MAKDLSERIVGFMIELREKHLSMENVRKRITEVDGYQPHLIAPQQGYRQLIESSLSTIRGPSKVTVDAVRSYSRILLITQ